jgi:DNA-binding IclR family transcriptional regulator
MAEPRSPSPAITRAAAILALLAERPRLSIGASELSRLSGVPKSTVLNLCFAMVEEGLLRRGADGYQLGHRLTELGTAYLKSVAELEEFYALCRDDFSGVAQTIQLGVLGQGLAVVFLGRHDGREPLNLGLAAEIGRSVPAHCTATGKALLAATGSDDLHARLPADGVLPAVTDSSISSVDQLLRELCVVRERGVSVEHGEIVEGLHCFGTAIRTPRRKDGLIGVSFTFTRRSTPEDSATVVAELQTFAGKLAERIGGTLAL